MPEDVSIWAYGKVKPGWYCAMWGYSAVYEKHLRELGYWTAVSVKKPENPPPPEKA